ncbi:hypothetical protein IVB30_42900 [Bradyrhizobium sp. 200]|uniref:hypothetical protein n=1 Tax=Bradyrhizobium sp. 200 TaxID=2782665 RepID=UPI001FFFC556|nr:hypothetical protein [Bradyrhizobium sp. 200]UPJ49581.1 hypothetical protein IVB30_42900 [Bradyrhizobium sp. 200]
MKRAFEPKPKALRDGDAALIETVDKKVDPERRERVERQIADQPRALRSSFAAANASFSTFKNILHEYRFRHDQTPDVSDGSECRARLRIE